MAPEGRKQQKEVQPRAAVLRRSFWAYRQLDMFQAEAATKALNPYARHLQRMRAMRDEEVYSRERFEESQLMSGDR